MKEHILQELERIVRCAGDMHPNTTSIFIAFFI